ncbi:MAG TPA: ABC transporter substrate-binding protein [Ignavibacteriaceae bacterium]|nr:ABC transporter substrate-binding protein [Ignavibacteriaceae bacterium]
MQVRCLYVLTFLSSLIFFSSCQKSSTSTDYIVVGIAQDVESINPLFAFSVDEGSISELLYLGMVGHDWNDEKGEITSEPLLAKNWEWSADTSSVLINLRDDITWSDGKKLTAGDVVFSFDIFSDPVIDSRLFGSFEKFYTDSSGHIDIPKTFEVLSPYQLRIEFLPHSHPTLFNIDLPIMPEHIYGKINRKDVATSDVNKNPVANGAFVLDSWDKNQTLTLKANQHSFLYHKGIIDKVIFKIIPGYTSRLTQLKKGEIDICEFIKPEDTPELKKQGNIEIIPVKGREYEYIGWNNIDPEKFNKEEKFVPNKFFGSARVRKALSYAINKQEILEEYLHNFGQLAAGPVSPIFKDVINPDIKPYNYNPEEAKKLLAEDGWKDRDNDGVLEKNGTKFSFDLFIPGGNPLRNYSATVMKNDLKNVGIDVNIQTMELNTFLDNLFSKKFNAWIASWYIALPIDLKMMWYSKFNSTPINVQSYSNKDIDKILDEIEKSPDKENRKKLYKQFQEIMHNDEPVTFLYWVDDITAHNKRIKNIDINPLGVIHHCWNWKLEE